MESIEILIPDKKGNHLVVVLSFYDEIMKTLAFQIPEEFGSLDIADISINKLDMRKPLNIRAFFKMCDWIIDKFILYPNAVFSYICSTDSLENNHPDLSSEEYRWNLFEFFFQRNISKLNALGVTSQDIVVGPEGYRTFAKVLYRNAQAPIIHLVIARLSDKYSR